MYEPEITELFVPRELFEIKPLKRGCGPMRAIGFDTETCHGVPMTVQLTSGYGTAKERQEIAYVTERTATKTFLDLLESFVTTKNELYVVFGHHLPFDVLSVLPGFFAVLADGYVDITIRGWSINGLYGRPTFLHFRKAKKRVLMVDTAGFTIGRQKLSTIADAMFPDMPKLAMPVGLGDRFFTAADKGFEEYAIRDAVIAERFGLQIIKWHEMYDIPMSLSGSNMAAKVYRKRFVTNPVFLPTMPTVWASMRSYHGGIQRAPFGKGYWPDMASVDMVSAYPFAMTQLPAFDNIKGYKTYARNSQSRAGRLPDIGVYRVRGFLDSSPYPAIFGKTFKPVTGEFDSWTTGWEYNAARAHGQLRGRVVVEGYYYDVDADKGAPAMKAYCEHFFAMKRDAKDKTERAVAKLLLNGLYGKMIQHHDETEAYYDIEQDKLVEDVNIRAGGLFNPFIASNITGHCRARLVDLEHRTGAIHSATDGVICPRKNIPPLSSDLGGYSLEATGDACILRAKLYMLYGRGAGQPGAVDSAVRKGWHVAKYALHGFRGNLADLEHMLASGATEYDYVHVVGLKQSLKSAQGWRANDFIKRTGTLTV